MHTTASTIPIIRVHSTYDINDNDATDDMRVVVTTMMSDCHKLPTTGFIFWCGEAVWQLFLYSSSCIHMFFIYMFIMFHYVHIFLLWQVQSQHMDRVYWMIWSISDVQLLQNKSKRDNFVLNYLRHFFNIFISHCMSL